jgi:hypothetical protein
MELGQAELFHYGTVHTIPANSLLWTTLPAGVTRDGIKLTLELEANMIKLLPRRAELSRKSFFKSSNTSTPSQPPTPAPPAQ